MSWSDADEWETCRHTDTHKQDKQTKKNEGDQQEEKKLGMKVQCLVCQSLRQTDSQPASVGPQVHSKTGYMLTFKKKKQLDRIENSCHHE